MNIKADLGGAEDTLCTESIKLCLSTGAFILDAYAVIAEAVSERTVALPFHNNLDEEQAETVVRCLLSAVARSRFGR